MKILGKDLNARVAVVQVTFEEARLILRACGVPASQRDSLTEVDLTQLDAMVGVFTQMKPLVTQLESALTDMEDLKTSIQAVLVT